MREMQRRITLQFQVHQMEFVFVTGQTFNLMIVQVQLGRVAYVWRQKVVVIEDLQLHFTFARGWFKVSKAIRVFLCNDRSCTVRRCTRLQVSRVGYDGNVNGFLEMRIVLCQYLVRLLRSLLLNIARELLQQIRHSVQHHWSELFKVLDNCWRRRGACQYRFRFSGGRIDFVVQLSFWRLIVDHRLDDLTQGKTLLQGSHIRVENRRGFHGTSRFRIIAR